MMHVTILGKRWKLRFTRLPKDTDGECDHPATAGKEIRISMRLRDRDELETVIHEALHAADWHRSEPWVEEVGEDLARLLWKLGYRKAAVQDDPTR